MKPFSLIIPALNEEEILEKNVKTLIHYSDRLKTPYELIVISNGSDDASDAIGKELQEQYSQVRFFSLPRRGVGRAFKKGIAESSYDHIIFMDADLSAELSFIEKTDLLLESNVMVLGAKIKGLQHRGIIRKTGSFMFYLSVLLLMGMKYVDYAPGAKAYRKDFLLRNFKYIDDYTSFVLNLTFIASVKKEPVVEIPIGCEDSRRSKFNLLKEAFSKYGGLLSLKFKYLFRIL